MNPAELIDILNSNEFKITQTDLKRDSSVTSREKLQDNASEVRRPYTATGRHKKADFMNTKIKAIQFAIYARESPACIRYKIQKRCS